MWAQCTEFWVKRWRVLSLIPPLSCFLSTAPGRVKWERENDTIVYIFDKRRVLADSGEEGCIVPGEIRLPYSCFAVSVSFKRSPVQRTSGGGWGMRAIMSLHLSSQIKITQKGEPKITKDMWMDGYWLKENLLLLSTKYTCFFVKSVFRSPWKWDCTSLEILLDVICVKH